MNIAIVDDLASDRLQLIGKLQTYMQQARIPFTLYEFDSGEAFLEAFSPGRFSIVFLDIYMGGMTGMAVAHAIREQDFDCRLIFLTQSEEYLREGYSVNAVHYLIKPGIRSGLYTGHAFLPSHLVSAAGLSGCHLFRHSDSP